MNVPATPEKRVKSSPDIRDGWKNAPGNFAKAAMKGAGFSFHFGGTKCGPEFTDEWNITTDSPGKGEIRRTSFVHRDGLTVVRQMRVLSQFDAIEYSVRFQNTSSTPLPPISMMHALDLSFEELVVDGNCLICSGGGLADATLPPRNFAIRHLHFTPTTNDPVFVDLMTEGGRSSNKDMPFFLIHNEQLMEGAFVAFGWSGQWRAVVATHYPPGELTLRGKIPDLDIALQPGEEIEGPTVLVGLYGGPAEAGSNRLRRLIGDVYTPKLAGQKFMPVITYDNHFGVGDKFDEALLMMLADGAAAIDQEYFLLDAGWYEGETWHSSVGNWERVSQRKFPNGLKPLAEHIRAKGMKFGLWFEPERVLADTDLGRQHPEWILWEHGCGPETLPIAMSIPGAIDIADAETRAKLMNEQRHGLLDFGRVDVQSWVQNMMDHYIREYRVEYIRYDMNVDPLPYWDANDEPNRRGITQLRYIRGLYAVIDWIRERHPHVVLEGCASGGRRIDLETARRFHTFWISDHTVDPSIIRFHLHGINHFLPGNYNYVQYTLPGARQEHFQPDDLGFQSMFGGAFGTGGRVDLWSNEMKRTARLHIEVYKRLRRYLMEDYYPLSAQPGDLKCWSGWQFHDPQDHSGFIQCFRTGAPDSTWPLRPKALIDNSRYRFVDPYDKKEFELLGREATEGGLPFTLAPMCSKLITYSRI